MLFTKNITSTGTQGTHAALTSREEDQQKISMMMIDTYSSPVTPIREIVVNGLEVAQNEPVKIMFEANQSVEKNNIFNNSKIVKSGNITIVDDGPGMSRDFVENFLFRMGASTKDGDENATGGFGIGAKSVFSITNSVTWRTTHEGVTTVAVVSRNGDSFDAIYESFETDDPSGTTVIIPVNGENYTNILANIHAEYFDFVSPDDLVMTVDGVEYPIGKYSVSDMQEGEVRIIDRYNSDRNTVVILSNSEVPYFYTLSHNDDDISLANILKHAQQYDHNFTIGSRDLITNKTLVLRANIAGHVIPNRESLKRSEELSKKIADAITLNYQKEVDAYKEIIDNATTAHEWRDALNQVKSIIENNNTFVYSVHDPLDMIFSRIDNFYSSVNTQDLEGKSIAAIDSGDYHEIKNKHSLYKDEQKINYLLGVNAHKSVKIQAWIDNYDDAFDAMDIHTDAVFVPTGSLRAWSTPSYVSGNNRGYYDHEFDIFEVLNNKISIEGLEVFARNLQCNHLILDMIKNKELTTPKDIILALSGAKDMYIPSELRVKVMEEGGKILSEQRKSGVKKPQKKKEPVHPLTIINKDKNEEDIWFNNPSEFTNWVKDNNIKKLFILNGNYADKKKREYPYLKDNSSSINMMEEMYDDGVVFIYAPGRDSDNTYYRIAGIIEKYNEKHKDTINISLSAKYPLSGSYPSYSVYYKSYYYLVNYYLAYKLDTMDSNDIVHLICANALSSSVSLNTHGETEESENGFADIASFSYIASDKIINDKGTSLFDYLKEQYARNNDVDIDQYNKIISLLQEIYPRDSFTKHVSNEIMVIIAKRMMNDEEIMKVNQIANLMKYKSNDPVYSSDHDKYFFDAIKNIEKFDNFISTL